MIKGLVSIIIPTHNRASLVVEAINSAIGQSYPEKQIIVIDDGSTDDTRSKLSDLPEIEYHYQENKGQGAARNYGLSFAKGEFIASLDSDDLWDTDFLSQGVDCLQEFDLDFVFVDWKKIRSGQLSPSEWLKHEKWKPFQKNQHGEWSLLAPEEVRRLFLDICPAPSSSILVRRSSIFSGWGEQMQIADDWYLLLEIALRRSCRAAFSLTPRWKKRVDGQNVYDGQPPIETLRKLYLHDQPIFRKDFGEYLTRKEKLRLTQNKWKYRLFLSIRTALRSKFAVRAGIPAIIAPINAIIRRLTD